MFKVLVIVVGALMLLSKQGDAVITNHPISQSVFEGLNVTFNCSTNVTSISTWKKDSTSVPSNSSRLIITSTNQTSVLVIIGLIASDAGNYSCVADDNETSNIAILTVKLIPRFSSHPSNQTKFQGEDANITCDVRGTTPLVVTWEKDGNDFNISSDARFQSSNDGKQLDITQVISSDSGSYVCVASNGVIKRSYPGSLVVLANPSITAHPINQTIIEGNNASLSCRATGIPVPDIRWQKDGEDLTVPSQVTKTTNSGVSTLHITGVKRTDEGRYVCVANNSNATIHSTPGILTVNYPPKILVPPVSQTSVETNKVTLTCYLEGKPKSTVTWLKDGTPVTPDSRTSLSQPNSTSNASTTITITNVNRDDEGNYSCQAVNDVSNTTSSPAMLTVNYPPKILVPPVSQTSVETTKVTLTCYLEGKPKSTVIWLKDGTAITPDSRTSVSQPNTVGNTSTTITITNVNRDDKGSYSCKASNDVNTSTSSPAVLTVNYPPKILVPPVSQTSVETKTVTLTCYLEGKPKSTVTWLKDGTAITPDNRTSLSQPNSTSNASTTITITNVNRDDEGSYSCQAVNDVSNTTSSPATLTVNYKPEITIKPNGTTEVVEKKNVAFTCSVDGKPSPTIQWLKNNVKFNVTGHSRFNVSSSGSVLTITGVDRQDEGSFSCNATNKVDSVVSSSVQLIVNYKPEITIKPNGTTEVVEKKNVTFTCSVDGKPSPTIQWLKNNAKFNVTGHARFSVSSSGSVLTITGVDRQDEGSFSCNATNKVDSVVSSSVQLIVNCKYMKAHESFATSSFSISKVEIQP